MAGKEAVSIFWLAGKPHPFSLLSPHHPYLSIVTREDRDRMDSWMDSVVEDGLMKEDDNVQLGRRRGRRGNAAAIPSCPLSSSTSSFLFYTKTALPAISSFFLRASTTCLLACACGENSWPSMPPFPAMHIASATPMCPHPHPAFSLPTCPTTQHAPCPSYSQHRPPPLHTLPKAFWHFLHALCSTACCLRARLRMAVLHCGTIKAPACFLACSTARVGLSAHMVLTVLLFSSLFLPLFCWQLCSPPACLMLPCTLPTLLYYH